MKNKLVLNHLYSNSLNIYGDLGNVIALQHHAKLMDVDLEVENTQIGGKMEPADIYFVGGGQDEDQMLVFQDLAKHKEFIVNEVKNGKIFLLVCGGFQLFGNFFIDSKGNRIEGLGILDMETKALDEKVSSRCIGNVVVQMNSDFVKHWQIDTKFSKYLVGFENHGGQSFLKKTTNKAIKTNKTIETTQDIEPIGSVLVGFGNNSVEKLEGAWQENILGTYLHGSLLPKNPHLANSIIRKALHMGHPELAPHKYGIAFDAISGSIVNFEMEKQAHEAILKRFLKSPIV